MCGNMTPAVMQSGTGFAAIISVMSSSRNYKRLYEASLQQLARQESLIALLQQQASQLQTERASLRQLNQGLQTELAAQQQHIQQLEALAALHLDTIEKQAGKLHTQKELIDQQQQQLTDQQIRLDKQQKDLSALSQLRYELRELKRRVYGIKSEKRHLHETALPMGGQLSMELETDDYASCKISSRRQIAAHQRIIKTAEPRKAGGRHELPEGLTEEVTILDVDEKPDGARLVGYDEQRQLACDPMRWYIKVIRRPVYLVAQDRDRLHYKNLSAPLPAHPIKKCKMDVSVLVLLSTEKFLYHMPVWRQQARLRRYGIDLPYSSLCSLINRTCAALEPLWHLLLKEIKNSRLIHLDETRYRVLDNEKKKGKKSHIGWMWASLNPVQKIVCFSYEQGRGKADIQAVLDGYRGYLMTDAYGAYTRYGRQQGVVHQYCLAHARRRFITALDHDQPRAAYALDQFLAPLYTIERQCKALQLDYDGITAKRQVEALPLLEAFHCWLNETLVQVTPRTPIYNAIHYTLKHFKGLAAYCADGMLSIDNNELEGQIRSIALGRHNHLFAGSHRSAQLAAVMYSFMGTCKLQGIDPGKWLDDVLRRITCQPKDRLKELLPQFWTPLASVQTKTA